MNNIHVVAGATGTLGQALVLRLTAEGIPVRAVARDAERASQLLPEGTDIVVADAMEQDSLRAACEDAAVIYNGVYVT